MITIYAGKICLFYMSYIGVALPVGPNKLFKKLLRGDENRLAYRLLRFMSFPKMYGFDIFDNHSRSEKPANLLEENGEFFHLIQSCQRFFPLKPSLSLFSLKKKKEIELK